MDFQKKPLLDDNSPEAKHNVFVRFVNRVVRTFVTVFAIFTVVYVTLSVYSLISGTKVSDIALNVVNVFGEDLKTDENNFTNFLLVGVGGAEHDGPNLTDTIILASFNNRTHQVSMLSIPRDLYVKVPGTATYERINGIYDFGVKSKGEEEGVQMLKEVVEKITGYSVQYYLKVDFKGFVQMVDLLDGIQVDVPETIVDHQFPDETNTYYTTFIMNKGLRDMDGKTALKYVRSRHSTSDFSRSARQQQVLSALKEKALAQGVLTNPSLLKNIYYTLTSNISTDLRVREIIRLAAIVKDIEKEDMVSAVLTDDIYSQGGLLYSPSRDWFAGQFVLIPDGASLSNLQYYKSLQLYAKFLFDSRDMFREKPRIEILNGTRVSGLATNAMNVLTRYGFNVEKISNAKDRTMQKTEVYYYNETSGIRQALDNLDYFILADKSQAPEEENENNMAITIVLGQDFADSYYKGAY